MRWKISEAKQRFSDLIRRASREPQLVYNRARLVAAVVSGDEFEVFQSWQERQAKRSLGEAFEELRRIENEEKYVLEIPPREDRPNPFANTLDAVSR
ncbi:MAG: type II toxin-antitoxin system prevent-host-death family antitoxin [Nitrospirae bacterium]|nr:type II toxin-antitoxin system prevent-host-death family antitoxin [Nitrospirota bacterium]